MIGVTPLRASETITATDQVFNALYTAIMTLELAPGSKVSEATIASDFQVSRQPVRDAFYRLSKLGFLTIRPQRATIISYISVIALRDARFIRTSLEVECLRIAIEKITDAEVAELETLLADQSAAIDQDDPLLFHNSDDMLHQRITEIAGHPSTWTLIREQKAHLDRIRYLSIAEGAPIALKEHQAIVDGIKRRDFDVAQAALRLHLARIETTLEDVRIAHAEYFEELPA